MYHAGILFLNGAGFRVRVTFRSDPVPERNKSTTNTTVHSDVIITALFKFQKYDFLRKIGLVLDLIWHSVCALPSSFED